MKNKYNSSINTVSVPTPAWVRTNEPLFWLGGCGHEIRQDPSYYYHNSGRREIINYVLQLTISGAGQYVRDGKRTLLAPGMAFFCMIPDDFEYGYPSDATEPYEQVFINIQGPLSLRWGERIVSTCGNVLDFGPDNHIAPLMLSLVDQVKNGLLTDRYLMSSQIYHVLMMVLSSQSHNRMAMSPMIARATEIIHRRAADRHFNIHELAEEMAISREHLTREFKIAMRVSPLDYLTQHRLRIACNMLRRDDAKLDMIAMNCGFAGANYFCRIFRQHVGITPAEFRTHPSYRLY